MIDLQDIITTKRELLSRETYSRNPINYSAGMAEDQKDRYIQYLAEQNQDLRLTGDAMRLVLEDFMAQMKELKDQMSSMQSKHVDLENRLSEEHKLRKSAERKIKSLQEKLDYAHQERFGDRRQKIKSKAKPGVFAKDIILHIIGDLGADYGVYKAVEFAGPVVNGLSISERMCMCNMSTEMGCKTSYIQPDAVTMEYLHNCVARPYKIYETDTDFQYAAELTYDVSKIRAQVAAPSSVDNVFELEKYAGTPVDEAYLGSCTGGRLQDLAVAAQILQGRHIPKTTRMIVVPASKKVMEDAMELGYIKTLMQAGAAITAPGCAACLGVHQGMLAGGEVCISSTNRNFPGRMGHVDGRIFLASPAAVAASALEGKITDPAVYLKTGDCGNGR